MLGYRTHEMWYIYNMGLAEKIQYIYDDNGKESHVVIPIAYYQELQELIEDLEDEKAIEQRRNEPGIPLEKVEQRLIDNGKLQG